MLSWEFPPNMTGGLGAHVAELAPTLAAQGVDLTLLTPRWKGGAPTERVHENAMVYRVDTPVETPSNYYADAQQMNLILGAFAEELWTREDGYDLVHAHDWLVSFAAQSLKMVHKVPLVATLHATERGRGGGRLSGEMAQMINGAEWWLTYDAWHVITTSHAMSRELRHFFELPADKISVIPNGVEPARFHPHRQQDLAAFRAEWALPDEKIIFYVGRMQREKGVHLLVEAAYRVLEHGARVKFILAGKGGLLDSLRRRVAELELQDFILLTGYVDDEVRDQLFCVADLAVFPSLYEPFGIVALEAMAAQCPVIVTDVGGLGEVVDNHITGIKIPHNNLDALVDSIEYMLRNPQQAREYADHAYAVVRHEYTWEHIARETIHLYDEIIRARKLVNWE
ncbi:MAG: glycosyltransferase family 1 protein [Chloroflexota bacterium]|nr:MAG: glycosyltransferase family 1 protein [Chloroflexota bacterium]